MRLVVRVKKTVANVEKPLDATGDNVSLLDAPFLTLFSSLDVLLNGQVVESDQNFYLQAYINSLLSTSTNYKEEILKFSQAYYGETPNLLDSVSKTRNSVSDFMAQWHLFSDHSIEQAKGTTKSSHRDVATASSVFKVQYVFSNSEKFSFLKIPNFSDCQFNF